MVKLKNGPNRLALIAEPDAGNSAKHVFAAAEPYSVAAKIKGDADLLFHRWSVEETEAKAASAKGSLQRKISNIENFVWRDEQGGLCLPALYVRGAMIGAARFQKDPSSPRRNAMSIYKAGIVISPKLPSLGVTAWDYEDKCRVVNPTTRGGINCVRPAMRAGWEIAFEIQVILPEYIDEFMLRETLDRAGRLIGVGSFRPTYGRFSVVGWERLKGNGNGKN
jgi:hypothetical protein